MASAESINVEFETNRQPAASAGAEGAPSLWDQARRYLNPGNYSLSENILASIAFILLILVIALAASRTSGGGSGLSLSNTCQTQQCLLRSAATVAYANLSADPCDDFFKFACGLAPYALRRGPNLLERTAVGELGRLNEDRLEAILRNPITRDTPGSYERKLKTFFGTCINDFVTEKIRGFSLALYLQHDLYLRDPITLNRFNLTDMLLKAYMIYGADVFFEYMITENFLDDNKYTISINQGGIELPVTSYLSDTPAAAKHRDAYKTYIRTIATFLMADADPSTVAANATDRVEDFVTDALEIETELARIAQTSIGPEPGKPPLEPNNMPTLQQMDDTYPPIAWSGFFGESFRPNAPSTTKVAVQDPDYLTKMSEYIGTKLKALYPGLYTRKLSNYMNWRIISRHVSDLSSGYVQARRVFQAALSVRPFVYENRLDYCYRKLRHFMREGVSALFVADHLSDVNKRAVDTVYQNLRRELTGAMDRLTWLDPATRTKAKEKIGAVNDRIGYSPTEVLDEYLDKYYETLNADPKDYMLDMTVSYENFRRKQQGSQLGKKPDRSKWDGATYDTNLNMNNAKVQLTVPAGIIQWPFYTSNLPGYINYATLGQRIAAQLIMSVDSTGQLFDKDGRTNPMWSAETSLSYMQRASCLNQTFSVMRAGPYATPSGSQYVRSTCTIEQ